MITDLHVHSTFSDGKLTIPELVDLYGGLGFGAIAITDHLCDTNSFVGQAARVLDRTLTEATFPLYMEVLKSEAERAWRLYRMAIIPGYELTQNRVSNHRSAHILALGVDRFLSANSDSKDIARALRATGALAVAAHPVSTRKWEKQTFHLWNRREELRNEFDAWEVASGPHYFEEVHQSGLPMLATSDLHHPKQMRSWKTVFDCERRPEAICEAIRNQELKFRFFEKDVQNDSWSRVGSLGIGALGLGSVFVPKLHWNTSAT